MRKQSNFSFRWKVVENYAAAGAGLLFMWLFVSGIVNSDMGMVALSLVIIAVAPFLVAYVDKKSARG